MKMKKPFQPSFHIDVLCPDDGKDDVDNGAPQLSNGNYIVAKSKTDISESAARSNLFPLGREVTNLNEQKIMCDLREMGRRLRQVAICETAGIRDDDPRWPRQMWQDVKTEGERFGPFNVRKDFLELDRKLSRGVR